LINEVTQRDVDQVHGVEIVSMVLATPLLSGKSMDGLAAMCSKHPRWPGRVTVVNVYQNVGGYQTHSWSSEDDEDGERWIWC
jgi:hypothetical protein